MPEQSLQILLLLLDNAGEVVSREDIRLRLWPNQTVVDYDQSIAAAVRRLRSALGESATGARFIETVARRGFRFLGTPERIVGDQVVQTAGSSLNYRLLAKLGEGGMGVVFRAEDLRLGRQVAIKFPHLSDSGLSQSSRERLEQEARTASSLNHPNICTIHGLEEVAGRPGIVMELAEGDTLAARLIRGPLPYSEAVEIAARTADALAEAHRAGMVHQDLKPSNIMLTRNGPKVLDFGLALIDDATPSPPGSTPGTLNYMSPEQMAGKNVDARSDIFSLGLVLYEMLSGRRPFEANSASALRAAVLEGEPRKLDNVPAPMTQFISRCLAKNPEDRWQSASDAREELDRIAALAAKKASSKVRKRSVLIPAAIVLILVLPIGAFWYLYRRGAHSPQPLFRTVPLTTLPKIHAFVAFSPDGSRVAYSWYGTSELSIYVKPIGSGDPIRVTNGQDDRLPQWSADGGKIAFQRSTPNGHDLMLIDLGSRAEQKLDEMGVGLAWSPDGAEIAYSGAKISGILVRSLQTGRTRQLTFPEARQGDSLPVWSPDGRKIAFTRSVTDSAREIFVVPAVGGTAKRLTFDKVATDGAAWTKGSDELVFASFREGEPGLWRISANGGTPERLAVSAHHPSWPAISRQGDRLAFSDSFRDTNVWKYERPAAGAGTNMFQSPSCLICSTEEDDTPRYSPDGRKIAFISKRSGTDEIWIADNDGKYAMQLTTMRGGHPGSPRWSPDGRWIAFDSPAAGSIDLYVVSSEGGVPRQLTFEPSTEGQPAWSHDGKWIYFLSNRGGVSRVWKIPSMGGAEVQVSQRNGGEPLESPDGKRLYYFDLKHGVWSMPTEGGAEEPIPELENVVRPRAWTVRQEGIYFYDNVGKPMVRLFSFATRRVTTVLLPALPALGTAPGLDISPDGRSLLFTQIDQRRDGLTLIENFR